MSTRETALKTKNLRRDPRVSLCVMSDGFYGDWIQVDGTRRRSCRCPTRWSRWSSTTGRSAASTPTGTTTAPRWRATSASSCASPPSAPVRTAPVESPPPSSPPDADPVWAVTRRSRCSSGGADRSWRGRSRPRCASGPRARSWSSSATAPTRSAPRSPPSTRSPRRREVVENPEWEEGIASSLRAALDLADAARRGRRGVRRARRPALRRGRGVPAGGGDRRRPASCRHLRRTTGQPGQAGA